MSKSNRKTRNHNLKEYEVPIVAEVLITVMAKDASSAQALAEEDAHEKLSSNGYYVVTADAYEPELLSN